MSLESFYHTGIYSDIVLVTKDGVRKQLHKIILSKSLSLFDELVKNNTELHIEYDWIYLESFISYMYQGIFIFNYKSLSQSFTNIISEFENILNSAVYLGANNDIITTILDHFNYEQRLQNAEMCDLCSLLYSLMKVYSNNSNVKSGISLVNLCNKIIINNLMKIDKYLGVYGDDYEKVITDKLYENMKCVWKLDDISSLTIIEFINYNLTKMLEKDINLKYLYQIANSTSKLLSINMEEKDTDCIKLNNTIIACISCKVLEKPSNLYTDIYKLMCETDNTKKDIIDKLITQKKTLDDKLIVINDFKRKLVCKICCTNELNVCLKGCGHLYCSDCIDNMIQQYRNGNSGGYLQCPICKNDFTKYDRLDIYF